MKKAQAEIDRIDLEIRRLMVREPNISGRRIAVLLKHDKDFIINRKKKIDRANRENINRSMVEKDLAELENLYRAMALDMYDIITSSMSDNAKIFAFNALFKAKRELIDSKMDAGIFRRELGKIEVESDLSPEQATKLDDAIDKLYGLTKTGNKKRPKNKMANADLHQIVNGGGILMYLPKAPEVLMKIMAKLSSSRCFRCWFFMKYD